MQNISSFTPGIPHLAEMSLNFFLTVMVFSMKNLRFISLATLPWTSRISTEL